MSEFDVSSNTVHLSVCTDLNSNQSETKIIRESLRILRSSLCVLMFFPFYSTKPKPKETKFKPNTNKKRKKERKYAWLLLDLFAKFSSPAQFQFMFIFNLCCFCCDSSIYVWMSNVKRCCYEYVSVWYAQCAYMLFSAVCIWHENMVEIQKTKQENARTHTHREREKRVSEKTNAQ